MKSIYVAVSLTYSKILQPCKVNVTVSLTYSTIVQPWKVYVTVSLTYNTILELWSVYVIVSLAYNTILHTLNVSINARVIAQNVEILQYGDVDSNDVQIYFRVMRNNPILFVSGKAFVNLPQLASL